MNSDSLIGYGPVGTNGPQRDKSPCEVAACLANEQAVRLFDALNRLSARLAPVSRAAPETDKPQTMVGECPQSQLHGELLGARDKLAAAAGMVERMESLLTV